MKLYIRLEAPFEWVRVEGTKVEAFGEVDSLADYPLDSDHELIGVVPGESVTTHKVSLPAKTRKQFQAALPYALEEAISEEVEDLHFVSPSWKAGEECGVLVVAKSKMREWQDLANQHRLPCASLLPDHALIPMHDGAQCTLSKQNDRLLVNQQGELGVSLDAEFIDVWIMDVPIASTIAINDRALTESLIEEYPDRDFRHWAFGSKMAHWLEHKQTQAYDLWTETYRPAVNRLSWRSFSAAFIVLGVALLVKMGFDVYRYVALHSEIKSINSQMQKIVLTSFPEIDFIDAGNERFIMEQALARGTKSVVTTSMHSMLAEAAVVLRREKVTLGDIVYRDELLIISCLLNDFSQVDKLTRELNARPRLSAILQSSVSDDGEIVASFELKTS